MRINPRRASLQFEEKEEKLLFGTHYAARDRTPEKRIITDNYDNES